MNNSAFTPSSLSVFSLFNEHVKAQDAGLHIIPLWPYRADGKCSCHSVKGGPCASPGKHPRFGGYTTPKTWTDEQLNTLFPTGYGVLLSGQNLLVVDVDERNGGAESYGKLFEQAPGVADSGWIVRSGSGGRSKHLYFRIPAGVTISNTNYPQFPGIDFKHSGQVIGAGSLHFSGGTYATVLGGPDEIGVAPDDLLAILARPEEEYVPTDCGPCAYSPEEVADMLRFIPNTAATEYEHWLAVGMAIHSALGDVGYQEWKNWSATGPKHDAQLMPNKWRSFGSEYSGRKVTWRSLIFWAGDKGWIPPKLPENDLKPDQILKALGKETSPKRAGDLGKIYAGKVAHRIPWALSVEGVCKHIQKTATVEIPAGKMADIKSLLWFIVSENKRKALDPIKIDVSILARHDIHCISSVDEIPIGEPGVACIKAPMGCGKTQGHGAPFAKWATAPERTGERFLATCHRVSLTDELCQRMGKNVFHYLKDDKETLAVAPGVACCVNSIIKKKMEPCVDDCKHIFIDEVSQVLRHVADGSFKPDLDRVPCHDTLSRIISKAKTVSVADADLNSSCIEFLEQARPGERFRLYFIEPDCSNLKIKFTTGGQSFTAACGDMISRLTAGQRIVCATDSKAWVKRIEALLQTECHGKRILCVHADNQGREDVKAFMADPEGQARQYDAVVHSPCISSGISIEKTTFDHGYGLFLGVVTPSDGVQMLRRCRTVKTWTLAVNAKHKDQTPDPEGAGTCLKAGVDSSQLIQFDRFRSRQQAQIITAKNDFTSGLYFILERQKYQIESEVSMGDDFVKEELKVIAKVLKDEHFYNIIHAEHIDDMIAAEMEQTPRDERTEEVFYQLLSHKIRKDFALEEITEEDLDLWNNGRGVAQVMRFSNAIDLPLEDEVDGPLSMRRFDAVRRDEYRRILGAGGFNVFEGKVTYDAETAQRVVDAVMEKPLLCVSLGICPGSIVRLGRKGFQYPVPQNPSRFVGDIFRRMGLKTCLKKNAGSDGDRVKFYTLDAGKFSAIKGIAQNRSTYRSTPFSKDKTPLRYVRAKNECSKTFPFTRGHDLSFLRSARDEIAEEIPGYDPEIAAQFSYFPPLDPTDRPGHFAMTAAEYF